LKKSKLGIVPAMAAMEGVTLAAGKHWETDKTGAGLSCPFFSSNGDDMEKEYLTIQQVAD